MQTSTIKRLMPFLLLLACLAYNLEAKLDNVFPNGAVTLGSTQTITGLKNFTATPTINAQEAATKVYVDQTAGTLEELLQQGSLRLYYVTATDSSVGGRLLSTTAQGVATFINYAALSATNYVQVNVPPRLSVANEPGVATLTAGEIRAVRYMSSNQAVSTARSVTGVNELWMVDADGTSNPTFIATSSTYVVLGTDIQRIATAYVLGVDTPTGGTTRRFLEKHYRRRTGTTTGSNPVIRVYYGGQYESFISVSLPSAVVMRTDACNAELPQARTCLDVYSKEETRVYTDTLATASALALTNHNNTSTAHNATTLASEAYVTGYAAKLAGDAAQDFSANELRLNTTDVGAEKLQVVGNASISGNLDITNAGYPLGINSTNSNAFKLRLLDNFVVVGYHGGYTGYPWAIGNAAGNTILATINDSGNASFSGDIRATSFTLGGNLKTGSNWISGDGDNEGIFVDGSGNIGVGTSTPQSKLHIIGNNMPMQIGGNYAGFITPIIYNTNKQQSSALAWGETVDNSTPFYIARYNSENARANEVEILNGNAPLILGTNYTEDMRITSAGEVLIATTTDAGDYKLQVNGNAYVGGTIQGAHVASDTTAGISTVVYLATQTMTFKDGLLVSVTNP